MSCNTLHRYVTNKKIGKRALSGQNQKLKIEVSSFVLQYAH